MRENYITIFSDKSKQLQQKWFGSIFHSTFLVSLTNNINSLYLRVEGDRGWEK